MVIFTDKKCFLKQILGRCNFKRPKFSTSFTVESFACFLPCPAPNPEAISSSSLVGSRYNFQAVLRSNLLVVSCYAQNRIQKQLSSRFLVESRGNFQAGFTVESRGNFQAVLRSNPEAISKQFYGRIQRPFQAFFVFFQLFYINIRSCPLVIEFIIKKLIFQ